jgi:hypothetical protein
MLNHPAQSLFSGCFPMGMTTLINAGLVSFISTGVDSPVLIVCGLQVVNQSWGFGGMPFLYALWGFWWLTSLISYLIAFGMLYIMCVITLSFHDSLYANGGNI